MCRPAFILAVVLGLAAPAATAGRAEAQPRPAASSVGSAPHFADGPLAEARAAFGAGNWAAARELVAKAPAATLPARYLAASAAARAKDWKTAAEEFEALAAEYGDLAQLCRVQAGRAWLAAREPDRAVQVLEPVAPDSAQFVEARFLLARAHDARRAPAQALAALKPLLNTSERLGGWVRALALGEASRISAKARDRAGEKAALLELWTRYPLSKGGLRAARVLPDRELPLLARARRAEALLALDQDDAAEEEADRVLRRLSVPHPAACVAQLVRGRALRDERRHEDAVEQLEKVVARCEDRDVRARALWSMASSQAALAPEEGRASFERLAGELRDHPLAVDALLQAVDLDLKLGDPARALSRLDAVAADDPGAAHAVEIQFRRFWIRWRTGDSAQAAAALTVLERLVQEPGRELERARARYWRARLLESNGDEQGAIERYAGVAVDHPATVYGMWSLDRVAAADPDRAGRVLRELRQAEAASGASGELGLIASDPRFRAGLELLRMGLPEAEGQFLAIDFAAYPPSSTVALFRFLTREGLGEAAARLPARHLATALYGRLDADSRALWEAVRGDGFRDVLDTAASRAGVAPDLFRALVHQESRFKPEARSVVGALGLAQLMPRTARALSRELGLPRPSERQLLQPALNARLGATYLAQLLDQFEQRPAFALAAYNAGPTRVQRWLRERGSSDVDVFVEEIPIEETRDYVKRILTGYAGYQRFEPRRSAPAVQDTSEVEASIEAKPEKVAVRERPVQGRRRVR